MLVGEVMIARVIVDIKHQSINQTFDYLIHEKDQLNIQKGMRVLVPFTDHNILRMGFVYDVIESSNMATKYVHELLDVEPIFTEELFLLLGVLTKNPNALVAEAFETVIPKQLLIHYEKQASLLRADKLPEDLKVFFKGDVWKLLKKDLVYYNRLKNLESKGIVKLQTVLKSRTKKPLHTCVRLINKSYTGTVKQNQLIEILSTHDQMLKKDLVEQSSASIVNTLIQKDVIEVFYEVKKIEVANFNQTIKLPELSSVYEADLNEIIENNMYQTYVSAYNDTKLNAFFMHLISRVLDKEQQVLILVPENFMTESIIDELTKVFGPTLIINLKSGQTDQQMRMNHQAILDNEASVVIGPRSAVFTNFNNLGLIVAMDSNNQSYIAHEGIHYDAIEIAHVRAKYHNIPLYLTSSALSLKAYHMVKNKQYKELSFDHHIHKNIEIIDMKAELLSGNTKLVSQTLDKAIEERFSKNQKVLLILNQKGYAPFVMCRSCSYVPIDPQTDIPLRYDEKALLLKSNLTKYSENFSKVCSNCGKPTMKAVGSGIDQLIHFLHKAYPTKKILKVDSDTITNKALYQKFDNLEDVDIIVGTQMALKSNLEHKVHLVGILMIDQWLKLPRFDAYETTYDLLSQARYITAKDLLIQSYDPKHFVLKSLSSDDVSYYKTELSRRKVAKLPPFYHLLQLRIEGISYLKTYQYAYVLKESLEKLGVVVLGPTASVLLKSNDKYRILLLIKYQDDLSSFRHLLMSSSSYQIFMNHDVSWY